MGEHDDIGSGWHLDKRVPLTIIMTIFIQTAGIVWWAASLENRVVTLEKANTEIATDLVADALQDINAKLDRLIERGPMPGR